MLIGLYDNLGEPSPVAVQLSDGAIGCVFNRSFNALAFQLSSLDYNTDRSQYTYRFSVGSNVASFSSLLHLTSIGKQKRLPEHALGAPTINRYNL